MPKGSPEPVPGGLICILHGGVEMETFCDGYTGYCSKWDGTTHERGWPSCQFDGTREEEK